MRRPTRRSSTIRVLDLIDEALAGVFAKPARAVLTTVGTVLGLASLVATLGISRTAGNQIVERFDELRATQVSVRARPSAAPGQGGSGGSAGSVIPWEVEERLLPLNGVVAAGAAADVPDVGGVRTVPVLDPTGVGRRTVPVVATSSGFLDAVRGHIARGRWFDDGHVQRADRVAVLGADLAADLQIVDLATLPGIYIGEELFTVIGIVDDAPRDRGLLGSVLITSSSARQRFGIGPPDRVVIETALGAARMIGQQAPMALSPNAPEAVVATAPAEPSRTREDVEGDLNGLFLLLGLISLVVGAIGIANVTLVTVMERTGEIGLRRALGARRRHIAAQILCESAAIGMVGGIIGASAGILTVVVVSAAQQWTPVLDPWLPVVAPPAGAVVGLLAGLYPSVRAARMEPVEALRAGT